jgi:hypothetical protein
MESTINRLSQIDKIEIQGDETDLSEPNSQEVASFYEDIFFTEKFDFSSLEQANKSFFKEQRKRDKKTSLKLQDLSSKVDAIFE